MEILKLFNLFKSNKKNPLHVNTFIKSNSSFQKKNQKHLVRRVALFNIFPDLSNVWLNRKQLSHICTCMQAAMMLF